MKKRLSLIALAGAVMMMTAGCGIVKVVPIGQEASFTGIEQFDAASQSGDDWGSIVSELTEKAQPLSEVLSGDAISGVIPVSASGSIVEFNTDTPKHYLLITVDDYKGDEQIQVQAGGVYSGTAVRDAQSLKNFEAFTNQTEWSQYAKSLNSQVDEQIVAPLALDESAAGKSYTLTGVLEKSSTGKLVITPISLTIE